MPDVASKAANGRRSRYPLADLPASEGAQTLWHPPSKPGSASTKGGMRWLLVSHGFIFTVTFLHSSYCERAEGGAART